MSKQRKQTVKYRNIRLSLDTYEELDKYLFELMQKRGERRLSLDDAVKALLDEHHSKER
jgi:hypothetical protein